MNWNTIIVNFAVLFDLQNSQYFFWIVIQIFNSFF